MCGWKARRSGGKADANARALDLGGERGELVARLDARPQRAAALVIEAADPGNARS